MGLCCIVLLVLKEFQTINTLVTNNEYPQIVIFGVRVVPTLPVFVLSCIQVYAPDQVFKMRLEAAAVA